MNEVHELSRADLLPEACWKFHFGGSRQEGCIILLIFYMDLPWVKPSLNLVILGKNESTKVQHEIHLV